MGLILRKLLCEERTETISIGSVMMLVLFLQQVA